MKGDLRGPLLLKRAAASLMTALHHHPAAAALLPFSNASSPAAAVHLGRRNAAAATMSTSTADSVAQQQKRLLRTQIRRALKALSPDQRSKEDLAIQNNVLDSSWFKSSTGLCAYISCESLREVDTSRILSETLKYTNADDNTQIKKRLYVPRVEDKNSHMRMLKISTVEDLVPNSMKILEPSPLTADGSEREDVMLASQPVDILLLPGLAFDRQGRRLGRGGGYYDVFLKKYQDLAMERSWRRPLLVALAYSAQIVENNVIPMTATDVPVDALVTASGVIHISPESLERV